MRFKCTLAGGSIVSVLDPDDEMMHVEASDSDLKRPARETVINDRIVY